MTVEEGATTTMGATLVETTEDNLCVVLARAAAAADDSLKALVGKVEELTSQGKTEDVLAALVEASGSFMVKMAAGEVESAMAIVAHGIAKQPAGSCEALAKKFVEAATAFGISSASANADALALSVLVRAYNAFPARSKARLDTLVATLNFAASVGKTESLAGALKGKSEAIKQEYGLRGAALRTFLLALSKLHTKPSKESFGLLTAYLQSFAGEDAAAVKKDANAEGVAKRAAAELVSCPGLFQCDFFAAIGGLAGSKVHGLMAALVESDVAKLRAFCSGNKAFLSELGLNEEQCLEKVRLLALATMGAQNARRSISYKDIVSQLDISEGEVELWLIKAIGLKMLEGRMDQLHQVFNVQKTAYKTFGGDEWASLETKLGDIHEHVTGVQAKLTTRK
mmetsp:Transcript_858/g.2334  ORF Transcript_858/g.2334 Transcript_858/m.2334 type:complete len:398 (+) Transcript_858:81-1274(+)